MSPLRESQGELLLSPPATDDVLRQRLADRVAEFNESTDSEERVALHRDIQNLRRLLRMEVAR